MIVIEGRFPTLNEYINVCRANRYRAARMKGEWDDKVLWAAMASHDPKPGRFPVEVRITVYEPDRRRDWDGSVGFAMKTVLDGLQAAGFIPNDDPRHVWPVVPKVEFDRERPRVEVEIVERSG